MTQNKAHKDRDEMLKRLTILDFMLVDLGLYLNVNPNDNDGLKLHTTVSQDADKIRQAYEAAHGPLMARQPAASASGHWSWTADPWPWEKEANFDL